MAHLTIELDGEYVATQELEATVDLGRSAECDLSVEIPFLSRRHLRLQPTSEGWRAVDLDSTNGSWIGGSRITDHLLQDGQVIQFGNLSLTFHDHVIAADDIDLHTDDSAQPANVVANSPALSDDEIAEILSRRATDSIDEEPAALTASNQPRNEKIAAVATQVEQPAKEGSTEATASSLWEVAMKPTPQALLQSTARHGIARRTLTESSGEPRDSAKRSLISGGWKEVVTRFETDLKFKAITILGLFALFSFGASYWLQVNGFVRRNDSRTSPAALNTNAQTASPPNRENLIRDLPV
jgi:hypothetical protein